MTNLLVRSSSCLRPGALALAALLVAALSACSSGDQSAAGGSTAASSAPTSRSSSSPGSSSPAVPAALAFTATTVAGAPFDAADLAGRPTAVWFWAPWCPTCRAAAPGIAAVAENYTGTVNVVGIAGLSKDTKAMKDFVASTGIEGFPSLVDSDGALYRRFSVAAQDTWAFIDSSGAVSTAAGLDEGQLRSRLDALVG